MAQLETPPQGNGYGLALATPYIFLFIIGGLLIYWAYITRKDRKAERIEDEKKRKEEIEEKRAAFGSLRDDVKDIGSKFETRTQGLENALREDSTAIRGILNDHHTRISLLELRVGIDAANNKKD